MFSSIQKKVNTETKIQPLSPQSNDLVIPSGWEVKTVLQHSHHLFCVHRDRIILTIIEEHIIRNRPVPLPGVANNLIHPRQVITIG
jgi:hypothetical protein